MTLAAKIQGCLIGTAVADAMGLPREGLSPARQRKLYPNMRHAFFLGRGMISDDTEHTVMVTRAYLIGRLRHRMDPNRELVHEFGASFAWQLRWWLLRFPSGVGLGTLRACLKLLVGFNHRNSGVRSAGNGPAMRSAILGLISESEARMLELLKAATRLTHTDPRAYEGALVITRAARFIRDDAGQNVEALKVQLQNDIQDEQLKEKVMKAFEAVHKGMDAPAYARSIELRPENGPKNGLGKGVSGFVNHTVPVALFCWLRYRDDYQQAVEAAIRLGGDTDTVAAIVGALAGSEGGVKSIPVAWLDGLKDWPCSRLYLDELSKAVANESSSARPPSMNGLCLLLRNVFFFLVVMTIGFRRLLPPY